MRKAFTLVELMIVVAIIGILASIAIPNFVSMQYRAKRAELPTNVEGIRVAETAYEASFDAWQEIANFNPTSSPSKAKVTWVTGTGFDTLGWAPDGRVRGAYRVTSLSSADFEVTGICDVDGDGNMATFTATKTIDVLQKTGHLVY